MPQVTGAAVKERAACLRQKGEAALAFHLRDQIGTEVDVLIERDRLGRTPGFAELELDTEAAAGRLVAARVTASTGKRLQGTALAPKCAS